MFWLRLRRHLKICRSTSLFLKEIPGSKQIWASPSIIDHKDTGIIPVTVLLVPFFNFYFIYIYILLHAYLWCFIQFVKDQKWSYKVFDRVSPFFRCCGFRSGVIKEDKSSGQLRVINEMSPDWTWWKTLGPHKDSGGRGRKLKGRNAFKVL